MALSDKTMTCRDCGRSFVFTVGEQQFYASHGLGHEPSRCPECRTSRKSSGGRESRSSGYGNDNGQRTYYTVTCSDCGREARVPFEPTSGKPVYCNDCYPRHRPSRY
ncbi:MAG: zinc-ribbon domain containing protein [Chloroflexi bacterium]|nr:zinc-ribbon domain containing protein [Chloroflexota bacterium]